MAARPVTKNNELLAAYRRGAKYLRRREAAAGLARKKPATLAPLPEGKRCLFSKDPTGKLIAQRLAQKCDVDELTMRADAKFAEAVEELVANCGKGAHRVLFSGRLNRKEIESIARTHPIRQRFEITQVAKGGRLFQKPRDGEPPFDTLGYYEVVSRLERAEGLVAKFKRACVSPGALNGVTQSDIDKSKARLDHVLRAARQLQGLTTEWGAAGDRSASQPAPRAKRGTSRLRVNNAFPSGCLGQAAGFIAKNVRDLPQMPAEASPTTEEARRICQLVHSIIADCEGCMAALTTSRQNQYRRVSRGSNRSRRKLALPVNMVRSP